jgi:hypothetical protein
MPVLEVHALTNRPVSSSATATSDTITFFFIFAFLFVVIVGLLSVSPVLFVFAIVLIAKDKPSLPLQSHIGWVTAMHLSEKPAHFFDYPTRPKSS